MRIRIWASYTAWLSLKLTAGWRRSPMTAAVGVHALRGAVRAVREAKIHWAHGPVRVRIHWKRETTHRAVTVDRPQTWILKSKLPTLSQTLVQGTTQTTTTWITPRITSAIITITITTIITMQIHHHILNLPVTTNTTHTTNTKCPHTRLNCRGFHPKMKPTKLALDKIKQAVQGILNQHLIICPIKWHHHNNNSSSSINNKSYHLAIFKMTIMKRFQAVWRCFHRLLLTLHHTRAPNPTFPS